MQKTISLNFQKTIVDFLFYRYDDGTNVVDKSLFHKHFNYEIHFALDGFYEYEFSDRKIVLCKNEMLIIPPEIWHKSVEFSEGKYDFFVLTLKFSSKSNDNFYDYFNMIFRKQFLKPIKIEDKLIKNVLDIYLAINTNSCLENVYLTSCATRLFYELCNLLTESNDMLCNTEEEKNLKVQIENLVNNPNISLVSIANKINYSTRQTERLIKKFYGKSLKEVREEFKWKKAKK